MLCGKLKKILANCKNSSEVIVFVETEDKKYRPFRNVEVEIFNPNSDSESLHFDVNVNKEYRSIHFPNNLTKDEVHDLKERRQMLIEELNEIDKELGAFK